MKIKLDENYFIRDGYGTSFELVEIRERTKKDSDDTYLSEDIIGYYGDLPQAVHKYVSVALKGSSREYTLKQYVDEYKNKVNELLGMMNE